MRHMFYRQRRWVPLLLLLLLCLLAAPVSAANQAQQQRRATTNLDARVYLPTEALKSIFQSQINQQITGISKGMMSSMLGSLPSADQGWMGDMAGALIQPSATLTQLTPQKDGLVASVKLSMFPGDPHPTDAAMLVTFSVRDASTIQVSAQPVPGSPLLANGPLTTFPMPVGQLQSVGATPNCGVAALNANIQLPVTFDTSQASNQSQNDQLAQIPPFALLASHTLAAIRQPHIAYTSQHNAANTLDTYVEIPNTSLAALGRGMGSVPIDNMWTARNLRIRTQGNGLVILSDISPTGTGFPFATATTYVQPSAENGKLVMHVTRTTLSVAIFSFANDSFNQKIENMLNSNLGNALAGKYTVKSVGVGSGTALPCAGSDSLILQGAATLN
jgi:hypothetical protein